MFRDARTIAAQRDSDVFKSVSKRYAATRETWFDGSVESIDARLGHIKNLSHRAEQAIAKQGIGPSSHVYLAARQTLENDRIAIEGLREDMLTGCSGRAGSIDRLASSVVGEKADQTVDRLQREGSISGADHRWLTLEAAKFLSGNEEVRHDLRELTERARRYASDSMSTRTASKSSLMTGLFVAKVQQGHRPKRPQRVARAGYVDFHDSMMFLR